jgi:hypothetical protein
MDFTALNSAVLDVFGDDPLMQPVIIGGVPVQAIYDSRHFAVEDGEAGTSDLITTITVPEAGLPEISDSTIIVVRGTQYRRWEARPDGQGLVTIQLERVD